MRKLNKVYSALYIGMADPSRRALIDSLGMGNKAVFTVVSATAIALTSVELYKKAFGETIIPSEDVISDIVEISKDMVFNLNEVTHVDIDFTLASVRSVLTRLYPIVDTGAESISSMSALFGNNVGNISDEIISGINENRWSSDAIFKAVKNLYRPLLSMTVEFNSETSILSIQ